MSVIITKVKNPKARPIMFPSSVICQHWTGGCERRATFIVQKFMGVIMVCPRHAD